MLSFPCQSCRVAINTRFLQVGEPALCRSCGARTPVPEGATSVPDVDPAEQYASALPSFGTRALQFESPGQPDRNWEDFPGPLAATGLVLAGFVLASLVIGLTEKFVSALFIMPIACAAPILFIAGYRAKHAGEWKWGELVPVRRVSARFWLALLILICGQTLVVNELTNGLTKLMPMPGWMEEMFRELVEFDRAWWLQFVLVSLLPGILEEVLFRGLILAAFLKRYSPARAILYSAVLFSSAHMNPWQGLGSLLGGIVLGWLFYRTGSLLPSILVHVLNNGLALLLTRLPADAVPGLTGPGLVPNFQGPYLDALGVALFGVGLYLCIRLTRTQTPDVGGEALSDAVPANDG